MKTVLYYHDPAVAGRKLNVLAENEDGTLNLGTGEGKSAVLVVGKCPIGDKPGYGVAVVEPEAAPAPAAPPVV